MKKFIAFFMFLIVPVFCFGIMGCPPKPVTPVPDADSSVMSSDDASADVADSESLDGKKHDAATHDATPLPTICALACENLAKFPCAENNFDGGSSCFVTCTHAEETKLFDMKPKCLADARTVAALRACGKVCTTGDKKTGQQHE